MSDSERKIFPIESVLALVTSKKDSDLREIAGYIVGQSIPCDVMAHAAGPFAAAWLSRLYPKFADLNIMFVEADFNTDAHCLRDVEETLRRGWDIIAIDSFYELQGIVKEEENLTLKKAESQLLSLIKKQNKAENDRGVHTTFLTIQQVTKSGAFIGSNRLKLLQRKRDIRPYYDIFTE